jgi:hypothetical protein
VKEEINNAVTDDNDDPVGLDIYDVEMDWPTAADTARDIQLEKTLIHFVIDDINSTKLGFGEDTVNATEVLAVAPEPDIVKFQSARMHEINFDVGVWASDKSGGSTSRLVTYQMLDTLFGSTQARRRFQTATKGVQIIRFNGGTFITERVNDVRTFRIIDCELVVRVFSRHTVEDRVIVEEIVQDPDLVDFDLNPIS